jgi:hypothetical protein
MHFLVVDGGIFSGLIITVLHLKTQLPVSENGISSLRKYDGLLSVDRWKRTPLPCMCVDDTVSSLKYKV